MRELVTYVPIEAEMPLCSILRLSDKLALKAMKKYEGRRIKTWMQERNWKTISMLVSPPPEDCAPHIRRFVDSRKAWYVDYEALLRDGLIEEVWLCGVQRIARTHRPS